MNYQDQLNAMQVGECFYDFMEADTVICVPGGWIFKFHAANQYIEASPALAAVFVPRFPLPL